jgi:hypothetical protein
MAYPTYNFEGFLRGNTIQSFAIATLTDQTTGDQIEITDAIMQVRSSSGNMLVKEWSVTNGGITLSGSPLTNSIVLAEVTHEESSLFPVGSHKYELVATLGSGERITILVGNFPILHSIIE